MTFAPYFVLDEPFLVFVACWGSGKTLLMITKAKELNELGEKVLKFTYLFYKLVFS
jgi:pantothenate kinase-related protein Tda10